MAIPTVPCEHKKVYSTFHGPTEVHVTVCVDCFVVVHLCSGTAPEIPPKLFVPPHGDRAAYVSALEELHHLANEWVKDPFHTLPALMEQIEAADSAKELMENMRMPHGPAVGDAPEKIHIFGVDLTWKVAHEDGSTCLSMPLRGDAQMTHSRAEYMNKIERGQEICAGVKHVSVKTNFKSEAPNER